MKVVGIDPAPAKASHVFESGDTPEEPFVEALMPAHELALHLEKLRQDYGELLISWDAPLTGPQDPDADPAAEAPYGFRDGDHTQRPIDKLFGRAEGRRAPEGISVRPYSGTPHWAMSRRLLGLPRVGPYDAPEGELPFRLSTSEELPSPGPWIAEVHPAVALWLAVEHTPYGGGRADWNYKKDQEVLRQTWAGWLWWLDSLGADDVRRPIYDDGNGEPRRLDDDQVDCRIAWTLGYLWCHPEAAPHANEPPVINLGSRASGSMLLPNVRGLREEFERFLGEPSG